MMKSSALNFQIDNNMKDHSGSMTYDQVLIISMLLWGSQTPDPGVTSGP